MTPSLPLPSTLPSLQLTTGLAGGKQDRDQLSFSPPPSCQPYTQPKQILPFWGEGLSTHPPRPHWPETLWNQNSGTSSGHLFSGNFSTPYQHLTALTSPTERRLIKMTNLTLIYYHTGENNKQPWHCYVFGSLSPPSPCISHACFVTEAMGKWRPQCREPSLCFLPSQVSSPRHTLSITSPCHTHIRI